MPCNHDIFLCFSCLSTMTIHLNFRLCQHLALVNFYAPQMFLAPVNFLAPSTMKMQLDYRLCKPLAIVKLSSQCQYTVSASCTSELKCPAIFSCPSIFFEIVLANLFDPLDYVML